MENINVESYASMESFAKQVLKLSFERQEQFFKELESLDLTTEEINTLKSCVTLFKMYTNDYFYKKVQATVCEMYMTTL